MRITFRHNEGHLADAIVEEPGSVTFNAHILETGTQSYRRRISKTGRTPNRKPN
jgi:hypothetical protein